MIEFENRAPTPSEYLCLRSSTGWWKVDDRSVEAAMPGSLFATVAVCRSAVVGCGRVIGGGGLYFYLQDVIVHPDFRRRGIGLDEVAGLFAEWLEAHYPDRARHVMRLVRQSRGGKDYDSARGTRMRGTGQFADLIEKRFRLACGRLGLNRRGNEGLRTDLFAAPALPGDQLELIS